MQDNTRVVMMLGLVLLALAVMGGGAWWYLTATVDGPAGTPPAGDAETAEQEERWSAAADQLEIARRAVQDDGLLALAIQRFRLRMERFPEDLNALVTRPNDLGADETWTGPYVNNPKLLVDPWETPYRIRVPGVHNPETYDLWSAGPDGLDDTADDVGNW